MSVPFSNTKLRVPKGFETLLEDFSREVLRSQPKCVIQFAAMHFSNLLKLRKETGNDPLKDAVDLEDRFFNNDSFKRVRSARSSGSSNNGNNGVQDHDVAATKIQAAYRGYSTRKSLTEESEK